MPDTSLYPRVVVDAPAVEPAWRGLFSVANMPLESDPRWQNGVEFLPLPTGPSNATTGACAPYGTPAAKVPRFGRATAWGNPFTIYEGIDCSPAGFSFDDARARALQALALNEQHAVERAVSLGALGNTPVLGDSHAIKLNGTTAVKVTTALRLIEDALGANYGGRGVIHMPRSGASALSGDFLLVEDGTQLRSQLGTLISAGGGYPGTAPGGAAPAANQEWWYGTGAFTLYRSEVFVPADDMASAFARATNDLALFAERTYVATWDAPLLTPDPAGDGNSLPVAWAVLVDLTL